MKHIYFLICLLPLLACEKEEKKEADYFREPILSWTHTKEVVKAQETRTLIADRDFDYYVIVSPIFESRGSGSLEYQGEVEKLTMVTYAFFSYNETLVQVSCEFVNNSTVEQELSTYLVKKYGDMYNEKIEGSDKSLSWIKPGMTITMNKSNYGLNVLYRKNPL